MKIFQETQLIWYVTCLTYLVLLNVSKIHGCY